MRAEVAAESKGFYSFVLLVVMGSSEQSRTHICQQVHVYIWLRGLQQREIKSRVSLLPDKPPLTLIMLVHILTATATHYF